MEKFNEDFKDVTNGESNAFAIQSEAYLEELRLGVDLPVIPTIIDITASYILTGKDKNSQAWKNYIKNYLKK